MCNDKIDEDVEKYFGDIEHSKNKRTLIDPLDDNAMIIAIKNFAKRNDCTIISIPHNKISGYGDFDVDINKIVNDNFWGIV